MRLRATLIIVSATVLVAGCTAGSADPEPESPESPEAARVTSSAPDAAFTLLADPEAAASALATSRLLFDSAEVVVVARDGDDAGTLLAASAAVALGVPLLLEPAAGGGEPEDLATELDRLGTTTVLAVGTGTGDGAGEDAAAGREVVPVPADPDAVAAATGLDWTSEAVAEGEQASAVAALDPERPVALEFEGAAAAEEAPDAGVLPGVTRGEAQTGTVVLTDGAAGSLAGIATARAAGAQVVLTGGTTDPRSSADVVEALSEAQPESVVALGTAFAAEEGLDWKIETAATGAQLPGGGGQLLFPGRLLVALYGHPGTGALGLMGEQPLDAAIERARAHAASYEPLVDAAVVPAFEIIATVASSSAGADGNYSAEADPEFLRPWVEAAGEAGFYVVLDLQPGRTDFVTQAEQYRSLLELPYVGLALDPEWRLGPGEVHLTQIGSVDVEEVNQVVTWLADLTRENALPQKLLVLHQFRVDMLPGLERLDMTRDELAIMIHVDGQGGQGAKQATWRVLHANAPAGLFWGWKNFYDEDLPMLTPAETIGQVSPLPELVTYQ